MNELPKLLGTGGAVSINASETVQEMVLHREPLQIPFNWLWGLSASDIFQIAAFIVTVIIISDYLSKAYRYVRKVWRRIGGLKGLSGD